MRATLNIPDDLLREVQEISGERSKTGAIVKAMEAYVRSNRLEALLALKGRVEIDFDWEAEEGREMTAAQRRERYRGR